jgi:hypothetical protein
LLFLLVDGEKSGILNRTYCQCKRIGKQNSL